MVLGLSLGFGIPLFYLLVGMVVYRKVYVLRMTEYRRWQNEAPNALHRWQVYGDDKRPRKEFSYHLWTVRISRKSNPSEIAWFWLVYALCYPIYRFTHPEIKVPSVPKIDELEKL